MRRHRLLRHRRPDPRTYRPSSSSTARCAPSTSPRPSSRRPRAASTASARSVGRCTARPRSLLGSPPLSPVWRPPARFSAGRTSSFLRWLIWKATLCKNQLFLSMLFFNLMPTRWRDLRSGNATSTFVSSTMSGIVTLISAVERRQSKYSHFRCHPNLRFCPGPNCPIVIKAQESVAKNTVCAACKAR